MEKDLEAIAKRRVQARMGFAIHALIYIAMNSGLVLIWFLTGHGYPWFLWPIVGWGIGLVAHGLALVIGPDSPREQRAIEREVQRLRAANR
jgi:hypothetical protein